MDLSFSEGSGISGRGQSFLDEAWPQEMRDKQGRSALGKLSKEDLVSWQKGWLRKAGQRRIGPEYGGAAFTPTESYIFDAERAREAPRLYLRHHNGCSSHHEIWHRRAKSKISPANT